MSIINKWRKLLQFQSYLVIQGLQIFRETEWNEVVKSNYTFKFCDLTHCLYWFHHLLSRMGIFKDKGQCQQRWQVLMSISVGAKLFQKMLSSSHHLSLSFSTPRGQFPDASSWSRTGMLSSSQKPDLKNCLFHILVFWKVTEGQGSISWYNNAFTYLCSNQFSHHNGLILSFSWKLTLIVVLLLTIQPKCNFSHGQTLL